MTDLMPAARYIAPDDGNVEDRTVLAVNLPQAVAPGATVAVEVAWTAHVPRTFRRTGVIGNYYFLSQWFPKLGVLEEAGWNTHQFHMTTEFFSDYGVYDVRLTVPKGWVVGATGVERSTTDTPAGKTVHQFVQEDVHDFAWTTGPDLLVKTARFEHPRLPAVDLRLHPPARTRGPGRALFPRHEGDAAQLRRVVRAVSLRPPDDRRSGLAERAPEAWNTRRSSPAGADGSRRRQR